MNHNISEKVGILLVNLGTPDSFHPKDVKGYLHQFLTDKRVIDLPYLTRQLLVRGVIVPRRYKVSARLYQEIWKEGGSPLKIHGEALKHKLQEKLGERFIVQLAMRYQNPSIEEGLFSLQKKRVDHLLVFPLFPQYASATTGSIHEKVFQILSSWHTIPKVTAINHFFSHPAYIKACALLYKSYPLSQYDHFLFSYHGLPEKEIKKGEYEESYAAQCRKTTEALASALALSADLYTLSFQSRLGKAPWLRPYTEETLRKLAQGKKKRVFVFCPGFTADCLETEYEIGVEYAKVFRQEGGEELALAKGLNAEDFWVEALIEMMNLP